MVTRHFLDWRRPLLATAAEKLLAMAGDGLPRDLSRLLVLTPTAQTGRRLRLRLALAAGQSGVLAPRVLTPEACWNAALADDAAGPLVRLAAWREVLTRPGALGSLQAGNGEGLDGARALQLARQLEGVRDELVDALEGRLDFAAAAARLGGPEWGDERWGELARLETAMREQLLRWGRRDPYAEPEDGWRAEAWAGLERVVLLGAVDPGPRTLRLLEQAAKGGVRIESWIAAPEERHRDFDGWGRPVVERWKDLAPPLDGVELRSTGRADELAEAAVEFIARAGVGSDEVALGLCDPAFAGPLATALRQAGWTGFDPQGRRAGVAAALPAVRTLRGLLEGGIEGLRELLALPGAEGLLPALQGRSANRLAAMSELWLEILPTDFGSLERGLGARLRRALELPAAGPGEDRQARRDNLRANLEWLQAVLDQVVAWRKSFEAHPSGGAALRGLAQSMAGIDDGAQGRWWQALAAGGEELEALEADGARIEPGLALELALSGMPAVAAVAEADEEAVVELSGWLELAAEDAPWLVLAGLHEGVVPAAGDDGPWLHDGVRRELGLRGREWRMAVESLRLTQLLACRRPERVCILVAAEAANGDARLPSRLILRGDGDAWVARILLLLEPEAGRTQPLPAWERAGARLELPEPPPERWNWNGPLSPSKLNTWLKCPLRFALQSVWKLERVEWLDHELSARGFGRLAHAVMEDFARDEEAREWTDSGRIGRWLTARLEAVGRGVLGPDPPLPARLQLESLRLRLEHFALWQGLWRSAGWRIHAVELELGGTELPWEVGGLPMRGIVDRIDFHEQHGWMIWDYKTRADAQGSKAAAGAEPGTWPVGALQDGVHLAAKKEGVNYAGEPLGLNGGKNRKVREMAWIDLQLPLYAARWNQEKGGAMPAVGQISLGTVLDKIRGYRWEAWGGEQADEVQASAAAWAEGAVAGIRAGRHWPEGAHWPWKDDDFAKLAPDGWERALGPRTLARLKAGAAGTASTTAIGMA